MGKKIAIFILTFIGISVSVDAVALGFSSVGVSHDNESDDKGYYVDYGVVLFLVPVGLHYESIDEKLSLFFGVLYPSCFGKIKYEYLCYFRVGFNDTYQYSRLGVTMQTYNRNIFVNISYKRNSEYDQRSSEVKDSSILFGISFVY